METHDTEPMLVSERLSRRRKAKGSSIVLNSHRVSLFGTVEKTILNSLTVGPSFNEAMKANITQGSLSNINNEIQVIRCVNFNAGLIQSWWRRKKQSLGTPMVRPYIPNLAFSTILSPAERYKYYALKISLWYRAFYRKRHELKFTQGGMWSLKLANTLFAQLILGPRVRRLVKSEKAKALITVINDLKTVVIDILTPKNTQTETLLYIDNSVLTNFDKKYYNLSSSDTILVKGLIKQYFQSKSDFHQYIFRGSQWCLIPRPGYLDLSAGSSRRFNDIDIRRSPVTIQKSNKLQVLNMINRGNTPSMPLLPSLTNDLTMDIITVPPEILRGPKNSHKRIQQSNSAPNLSNNRASKSLSNRFDAKAHIQLDILSAERLMPAKKGSATRDAYGEIIPDRKPCIRVTLNLPSLSSNGDKSLKKSHQAYKEYNVTTLNPRWGETMYLPLPCPKNIIQSLTYEEQCEELLAWWGLGNIVIQIVDGERFNEAIFLGEVSLFLSSLLVPGPSVKGKGKKKHVLETSGVYTLNKVHATDRVSGTIHVHTYLHLPDPHYLRDVLAPSKQSRSSNINHSNQNDWSGYNKNVPFHPIEKGIALSNQTSHRMDKHSLYKRSSPDRFTENLPKSVLSSPPQVSLQRNRRQSMMADVSKCLLDLSDAQVSADLAISHMNRKLEAKRSLSRSNIINRQSNNTFNQDTTIEAELSVLSTSSSSLSTSSALPIRKESVIPPPFSKLRKNQKNLSNNKHSDKQIVCDKVENDQISDIMSIKQTSSTSNKLEDSDDVLHITSDSDDIDNESADIPPQNLKREMFTEIYQEPSEKSDTDISFGSVYSSPSHDVPESVTIINSQGRRRRSSNITIRGKSFSPPISLIQKTQTNSNHDDDNEQTIDSSKSLSLFQNNSVATPGKSYSIFGGLNRETSPVDSVLREEWKDDENFYDVDEGSNDEELIVIKNPMLLQD